MWQNIAQTPTGMPWISAGRVVSVDRLLVSSLQIRQTTHLVEASCSEGRVKTLRNNRIRTWYMSLLCLRNSSFFWLVWIRIKYED